MADILRRILDTLGRDASADAGLELSSLCDDPALGPWRELAGHYAAVQVRLRRDTEFKYPSVDQVIETLGGGRASNIRDLRGLVSSHLRVLADELRNGSTDGYKAFWNVDSARRPETPRPENDCRDRLLEHLRPRLAPAGVIAEREGSYADDNRADIHVLANPLALPIEIKRHYHPHLWSAPHDQLRRRYAREPRTHGHGIYVVLWFGLNQKPLPAPPAGISRPTSAMDLESALYESLPEADRAVSDVIVLDCARSAPRRVRSR